MSHGFSWKRLRTPFSKRCHQILINYSWIVYRGLRSFITLRIFLVLSLVKSFFFHGIALPDDPRWKRFIDFTRLFVPDVELVFGIISINFNGSKFVVWKFFFVKHSNTRASDFSALHLTLISSADNSESIAILRICTFYLERIEFRGNFNSFHKQITRQGWKL